jgi:ATP-dependent DNA helicase RecQ
MSQERLLDRSDVQDPEVALQQRRAVRRMFDLADASACLWRRLVGYFAESIAPCGDACGCCLGRDLTVDMRRASGLIAGAADRARSDRRAPLQAPGRDAGDPSGPIPDPALFERLRALRKKLADERQVPAFVIFSDRALQDMAARRPRTRGEFLEVNGVGQRKLQDYGDPFLAEILRQP